MRQKGSCFLGDFARLKTRVLPVAEFQSLGHNCGPVAELSVAASDLYTGPIEGQRRGEDCQQISEIYDSSPKITEVIKLEQDVYFTLW